jgi:hypothetical protein
MKGFILAGFVGLATVAAAQDIKFGLGLSAGAFLPSDSALRDAFGDSWFSFGISPSVIKERNGLQTDWDFRITGRSRDGNRILMMRPTFGVSLALGFGEAVPYVAARAGLSYLDYAFNVNGARVDGRRVGPTTNFEIGILFSKRLGLSLRYDWIASFDGVGFSGLTLSATYQVFRF